MNGDDCGRHAQDYKQRINKQKQFNAKGRFRMIFFSVRFLLWSPAKLCLAHCMFIRSKFIYGFVLLYSGLNNRKSIVKFIDKWSQLRSITAQNWHFNRIYCEKSVKRKRKKKARKSNFIHLFVDWLQRMIIVQSRHIVIQFSIVQFIHILNCLFSITFTIRIAPQRQKNQQRNERVKETRKKSAERKLNSRKKEQINDKEILNCLFWCRRCVFCLTIFRQIVHSNVAALWYRLIHAFPFVVSFLMQQTKRNEHWQKSKSFEHSAISNAHDHLLRSIKKLANVFNHFLMFFVIVGIYEASGNWNG